MNAGWLDTTRGGRWLVILVAAALGMLVLAVPATAQNRQSSNQSDSCNAGDGGGDESGDSDGSGNCSVQQRNVQQRAGGDVSRSINQSQSFGDDDDRARSRSDRDDDDGDRERRRSDDDTQAQEDVSAAESSDDFDCEDFSSQADAQAVLDEDADDPNQLDSDDDGRACEDEFTRAVSGSPEGGVETGGGGTLPGAVGDRASGAADVARVAGPALSLALIVGGLVGLRRRAA